jgi:hypothetical protein
MTRRLWENAQRPYAWSVVFPNTIRVIESSSGGWGRGDDVARVDYEIHAYGVLWETPKERTPLDDLVRWEDKVKRVLTHSLPAI